MELKIIEGKTLVKVKESIKKLLEKSRSLARYRNKEEWLDNQDVCQLLNISLRTLQDWRDTGVIPFIQIRGKILYRQSDVMRLIENNMVT